MDNYREVFVGIDTSKSRNAIAIAEAGRGGDVRFFGEIDNAHEATRKLVAKLPSHYQKLHFCYEAGPTGYGLYRWLINLGQTCDVVAPSLITTRPGDHVKTNRRDAGNRIVRIEKAIVELVAPQWSLAPVVEAIQAMRGIDFIAAVTFMAEIGDLNRFTNPRQLMGYLGLTPSEDSTGDSIRRGGITKAGNGRARKTLVESAWSYRFPARIGRAKLAKIEALPKPVVDIAWKAQTRLCARYRALVTKGKKPTVAVTAIAREMAAFIWAIAREVQPVSGAV